MNRRGFVGALAAILSLPLFNWFKPKYDPFYIKLATGIIPPKDFGRISVCLVGEHNNLDRANKWSAAHMLDLKKGNLFYVVHPDEGIEKNNKGVCVLNRAEGDGHMVYNDIPCIIIDRKFYEQQINV